MGPQPRLARWHHQHAKLIRKCSGRVSMCKVRNRGRPLGFLRGNGLLEPGIPQQVGEKTNEERKADFVLFAFFLNRDRTVSQGSHQPHLPRPRAAPARTPAPVLATKKNHTQSEITVTTAATTK